MKRILEAVAARREGIVGLARELVRTPGESGSEGAVAARLREAMEKARFDEVSVDPMGNVIGRIGAGSRLIALDGHLDTVGVGQADAWPCDPFEGKIEGGRIYGLGSCDQKGALACMVHAGSVIKELRLEGDTTLYLVGSVCEEACEGLAWRYIIEEDRIRPECVILTEPTDLKLCRGHRGRMEIRLRVRGRSTHASTPDRGENAVYTMAPLIGKIRRLGDALTEGPFLGKGTVAVTRISSLSPSLCAVPDGCEIVIDRRLAEGETRESALGEIRALAPEAEVFVPDWESPSYTGLVMKTERVFPSWTLDGNHPLLRVAERVFRGLFGREGEISGWGYCSHGAVTMGVHAVPTLVFGPGDAAYAHTPEENVPVADLLTATAFYAAFPSAYAAGAR